MNNLSSSNHQEYIFAHISGKIQFFITTVEIKTLKLDAYFIEIIGYPTEYYCNKCTQ